MVKGKVLFVPVSSHTDTPGPFGIHKANALFTPVTQSLASRNEKMSDERTYSLTWWKENSFFYHPALLVSAFYFMKDWDFREKYKIPRKDFLVIGDSGGFQLCTQADKIKKMSWQKRLDPIDVIGWQEKNTDIGFILDVPPIDPKSLAPTGDFEFFKSCADRTKRNAESAIRSRTSDKFKLYGIVQGGSLNELDYWYGELKDLEFDGWTLSPKPPTDPMQLALFAGYAMENYPRDNLHILLATGRSTTPLITYIANFFKFVTFDSSTFSALAAVQREYVMPHHLIRINFGRRYEGKLKTLPCDCPICSVCTVDDFNDRGSVSGALLALHNLHVYLKHVEFLSAISEDETILRLYLKSNGFKRSIIALDFLLECQEKGFDVTHKKYKKHFKRGVSEQSVKLDGRSLTEVF